ncbi:MAG: FG-GAP-like repeat-containing protein [Thermodesulfobacteriota bacterium]
MKLTHRDFALFSCFRFKGFFPSISGFILFLVLSFFWVSNSHCAQVTLAWDPNREMDLAGYKIYYGTSSRTYQYTIDVGNVTSYSLGGLNSRMSYYIAATAYNTHGIESGFSNEVVYSGVYSLPVCTYILSPSSASFSASGGSGTVTITTQSGCNWTTSSSGSWVAVTSGSGLGTGTVRYSVAPNPKTGTRVASLTVAGNVFTVTEAGQTFSGVIADAGAGGTISPSGPTVLQPGQRQPYTITPQKGFKIADVVVDGVSKGAITSYTFSSTGTTHTISASFVPVSSSILPIENKEGGKGGTSESQGKTKTVSSLQSLPSPSTGGTALSAAKEGPKGYTTPSPLSTLPEGLSDRSEQTKSVPNYTAMIKEPQDSTHSDPFKPGSLPSVSTPILPSANETVNAGLLTVTNKDFFQKMAEGDLLWRHNRTGQIAVWVMNGLKPTESLVVADYPDLNWKLAGRGDFNHDGKKDLLWRHGQTGQLAVWLMNGFKPTQSLVVADYPDLNWKIAGTGDFNQDGKTDILWRHDRSGQVAVWLMNGVKPLGTEIVADYPDLTWKIAATGDFNGDGKTDILWRHSLTGQVTTLLMNGVKPGRTEVVAENPDLHWMIVGTGDYSQDGKTDILWRHSRSGRIEVWPLKGLKPDKAILLANYPDLNWEIVGP